ncbi:MAG TPA: M23 family metallopeptidase [bacterium]|nr:M23 family metallopeptidase [bacterium]
MARGIKRKKSLTIMLVPDDNTTVFSLKLGAKFLIAFVLLWAVSVVVSVIIIGRHANYRATQEYNRYLVVKQKEFAKEVLEARETVKRVSEIEKQLKDLLQLKSRNAIIKYTGFGGPSYIDTKLLEENLKSGDELISRTAFETAVRYVDSQARANEAGFQEIIKYITQQRARLTAVPSGWPVRGWITAGFGSRIDPFTGALSFHQGVDIANDLGTPVRATADGVIHFANFERGYGNIVSINHGNGYLTRYGHLQRYVVSQGQHVKKEQVIGYLGNTGRSTAPHLHYEVLLNGVGVNPVRYLNREVALK